MSPKLTDYFIHGVRKYVSPKLMDYFIQGVRKYSSPKLTEYFIHRVRKYISPKLTDYFIHRVRTFVSRNLSKRWIINMLDKGYHSLCQWIKTGFILKTILPIPGLVYFSGMFYANPIYLARLMGVWNIVLISCKIMCFPFILTLLIVTNCYGCTFKHILFPNWILKCEVNSF